VSRRQQLEDLRRLIVERDRDDDAVFATIVQLLEQAIFIDELPPELSRVIIEKRSRRSATEKQVWRRRYRCKKHGTITGPLCGDCAQEKVSASSLVEEVKS
jgi:hypothetical protein